VGRVRFAALTALVLVAWSTLAVAASQSAARPIDQPLLARSGIVTPFARTTLREAAAKHGQHAMASKPFLTRNPQALAAAKASPRASGASVTSTVPAKRMLAGSPNVTAITGGHVFSGISQDLAFGGFGQNLEPPDTMAAAGPFEITEMVNNVISIYDKFSGTLTDIADLNVVFPRPSNFLFTDPRVLFDQESGRWFLSGLDFFSTASAAASQVFIGVTDGPSMLFSHIVFYLIEYDRAHICDQPKLGVNTTMVSISCANFDRHHAFTGQSTFVINKAQMVALQAADLNRLDTSPTTYFSITPVQSLTPTGSAWMVENDSGGFVCGSPSLAFLEAT
jgi:hypothetical protein